MPKHRKRFAPRVYVEIVLRQNGRCACCGEKFVAGEPIQYDHILPIWLGGKDEPENLQAMKHRHHNGVPNSKTAREAKARAKIARIKAQDGLLRKKPNAKDKAIAKMLNLGETR